MTKQAPSSDIITQAIKEALTPQGFQEPRIGDANIHFCHNPGLGQPPQCVAAIVTRVSDASRGFITVREFEYMHLRQSRYSVGGEFGSWHWNRECRRHERKQEDG